METDRIRQLKIPPVSKTRIEKPAEEWSELVKKVGIENGGVAVGIQKLRPEWVIDTFEIPYDNVITIGVAMDFENLKTAPEVPYAIEVIKQYGRAHIVCDAIGSWIHSQGWDVQ